MTVHSSFAFYIPQFYCTPFCAFYIFSLLLRFPNSRYFVHFAFASRLFVSSILVYSGILHTTTGLPYLTALKFYLLCVCVVLTHTIYYRFYSSPTFIILPTILPNFRIPYGLIIYLLWDGLHVFYTLYSLVYFTIHYSIII